MYKQSLLGLGVHLGGDPKNSAKSTECAQWPLNVDGLLVAWKTGRREVGMEQLEFRTESMPTTHRYLKTFSEILCFDAVFPMLASLKLRTAGLLNMLWIPRVYNWIICLSSWEFSYMSDASSMCLCCRGAFHFLLACCLPLLPSNCVDAKLRLQS